MRRVLVNNLKFISTPHKFDDSAHSVCVVAEESVFPASFVAPLNGSPLFWRAVYTPCSKKKKQRLEYDCV
jgi:hypothetical protein